LCRRRYTDFEPRQLERGGAPAPILRLSRDWNEIAEQSVVVVAKHPPPVAALDFAILHAAIYDAVEAIDGKYRPYHVVIPGAHGSLNAAASKAAHDILVFCSRRSRYRSTTRMLVFFCPWSLDDGSRRRRGSASSRGHHRAAKQRWPVPAQSSR